MELEVSLLVTNETAGGLIGTTHTSSKEAPFAAKTSQLERLPPCAFASAVPNPAGNSNTVKFQVQNFGKVDVTVATASPASYIKGGLTRHILGIGKVAEFTMKRSEQLLLVPYAPPPPDLQAREFQYNGSGWHPDGVHLKWTPLTGVAVYRIYKLVLLQKGNAQKPTLYQKWQCDTSGTEFHDSDLTHEEYEGYTADTTYYVSALPYPDFPGFPTPGVPLRAITNEDGDWVDPKVGFEPEWFGH